MQRTVLGTFLPIVLSEEPAGENGGGAEKACPAPAPAPRPFGRRDPGMRVKHASGNGAHRSRNNSGHGAAPWRCIMFIVGPVHAESTLPRGASARVCVFRKSMRNPWVLSHSVRKFRCVFGAWGRIFLPPFGEMKVSTHLVSSSQAPQPLRFRCVSTGSLGIESPAFPRRRGRGTVAERVACAPRWTVQIGSGDSL